MIWFIVGLIVGGSLGFIVMSCLAANGVTWWRGRSEHLEKLICKLAKEYPSKLWNGLPNNVRDECQRIIEKSYREDWRVE